MTLWKKRAGDKGEYNSNNPALFQVSEGEAQLATVLQVNYYFSLAENSRVGSSILPLASIISA